MSWQDVRTEVLRYGSADSAVVSGTLVGGKGAATLWKAALGAQEITIKNPHVLDRGDRVIVTGKASFLEVEGMPVEMVFEDDHATVRFRLTANLPDTWKFSQSFPNLAPYFNYDSLKYGYRPSYLNELRFSAPAFVLTTHPYKDASSGIEFQRGLNFLANIDVSGPLKGLELITGIQAPLRVSGLIISDTPTPEFCLSVRIPLNLGRDANALRFDNVELKLWNSLVQERPVAARIEISLQLSIAGKSIEVYCPFRIGAPLDFLVIGGRFSSLPLPDLADVAHLVGGDDLGSRVPPSLKGFGGLTVEEVATGFSLRPPDLAYVKVCVRTTSPWTVILQIFEIDSLALTWLVESPFKSERRHISCQLEGLLHIADVSFSLYAEWPDFLVSGALALGSVIKVGALLKHFVPSIPIPDDSLIISRAALLLDPTSKTYQIDASVDNVWSLTVGGTTLAMNSLSLSLTKSAGGLTGSLTGGMSLRLNDGDAESELTLSLAASLPPPSAKGWQFTAKTGPGQRIHVDKLIEWIAKGFGPTPRPTAIAGFTIQNLGISFNTESQDFFFTCEGAVTLPGQTTAIEGVITIDIKHQDGSYTKLFGGSLTIDGLEFDLVFESAHKAGAGDSRMFVAAYHDTKGHTVKIDDLIKRVFATPATTGLEISLKDALFAYRKTDQSEKYLFGLDIEGGLNLSDLNLPNLPLIGQAFPAGQTLKLTLQVLAAGKNTFTADEINGLNRLYGKGISLPQQDVKGLKLAALLRVGQETKPVSLPIALGSPGEGLVETETALPAAVTNEQRDNVPSANGTQWIKIQKTFGPIHVERVGIGYQSGNIALLLDSALTVAGLTLSLDGLGAEFALKDLAAKEFKPTFHLNGLGIDYRNGPIEIGGSFLEQKGTAYTSYAGLAVIRTAKLTLSAIGSYSQLNDRDPSLFIYAVANYPLGGPAFFYVTGFAAGFGYNRALTLPPIEAVASFPLVAEAVKDGGPASLPSSQKEQQKTLTDKLQQLEQYLPPSVGDIFVAAGIKFTSFKQIDSFALLVVKFGRRFEIDLLGLSTLTAPPPEAGKAVTPVAEAQLALKASFVPDEGFLGVRAQLTSNSYILSKDCHLSGGFAFYTWFEPHRQAGDFVLTLGGYHPKFIVPDHYPQVPRLALNWQVSAELHVKADAYFALTSSCIMAGAHLEATWHSGALRAWFNAGADFILAWKPYHYDLAIYVGMGVSYTFEFLGNQTVTADLGADLHLWGPEFSGTATIHWSIISFTVNFGKGAPQELEPIDWNTFKTSFLPEAEQICSVAVQGGLVRQLGSSLFSVGDFIDLPAFVAKLRTQDPISKYLWDQFSASTQEVLTSATSTPEEQKLALVQALDNILKGVLIYETVRFAGVALSPETLALRSQNPKGNDLIRLNRLLLEDAYPLEIAKSQAERWIVNPKEMALAINSVVPLNKVEALATYMRLVETGIEEKAKQMAIAPMGIESNLTSTCSISITRDDGQPLERDSFQVRPIWKPMPAGLWGKPNLTGDRKHLKPPNLNGAQLVENTLTGFEVRPVEKSQQAATCQVDREDLQYTTELIKDVYGWREFQSFALRGRAAWKGAKTAVSRRDERDQLLKALGLVNPVIDLGEPMDQGILLAA